MSYQNYLPKRGRNPAPSEIAEAALMSPAMHELARKKRCHKRAMSILGKCLFASMFSIEAGAVPIGAIIKSIDPLTIAKARPKATKSRAAVDLDLDLL